MPEALTLCGAPVPAGVAMAVVLDAALAAGFEPDGFEPGAGRRRYRYVRAGATA